MSENYTIGQLAREAGVPISTVRYYERRGLLCPESRSEGNYRMYGDYGLDRLRFVKSAQTAGFTLADIGTLLRFRDGDIAPCREVQTLITSRLGQVTEQMGHLQMVRSLLRKWRRICRQTEQSGRCGVIEGLAGLSEKKCAKSKKCS